MAQVSWRRRRSRAAGAGGSGARPVARGRAGSADRRVAGRDADRIRFDGISPGPPRAPVLEALGPAAGLGRRPADGRRMPALRRSAAGVVLQRCGRGPRQRASRSPAAPAATRPGSSAHDVRRLWRAVDRKLPIYGDGERFPHLRVDACDTLRRLPDHGRSPEGSRRRVRSSTSWSALPLDLYARERGFAKIVPEPDGNGRENHHGQDGRLLHRHDALHRLQGVRGRVQGVEPARGTRAAVRRRLRQHRPARRGELAARPVPSSGPPPRAASPGR